MIKKLRVKFIAITMTSVIVLLAAIMAVINIVNYHTVTKNADNVLSYVVEMEKNAPQDHNPVISIPDDNGRHDGISKETPYDSRYFTVTYTDDEITSINIRHIVSIDEKTASSYASSALKKNKDKGYISTYRYRIDYEGNRTYVIFLDYSRQLEPTQNFFHYSLIVASAGVVVAFVIVFFISKLVVKPVKESQEKQKRFLTDAGHELKTPLTIISANNELIQMENGESEYTKTIAKEVEKMTVMVRNISTLNKMDESPSPLMERFSLSDAAFDLTSEFLNAFKKENKELSVAIEEGLYYKGNEKEIRELLSIILDNALKYSKKKAEFSLNKSGRNIILLLRNDADDVKEGNLDKVFERFYRSEEARGSTIEGSGIGLSLAQEIVQRHKGKISAYGDKEGCFNIRVVF